MILNGLADADIPVYTLRGERLSSRLKYQNGNTLENSLNN